MRLLPLCSPAVGEDSLGEPPMDSYALAIAHPQQHTKPTLRRKGGQIPVDLDAFQSRGGPALQQFIATDHYLAMGRALELSLELSSSRSSSQTVT